MAKFKTRQGLVIDDIKAYVTDWLSDRPDAKVYIGCDSQVRGKTVSFAVSVCLYQKGKGGHIVSRRTTDRKMSNNNARLWEEVNKSIEAAEELKGLDVPITIHVDYNSNPKAKSNELYEAGIGYATSLGYEAAGKPLAWAASKCADNAVR